MSDKEEVTLDVEILSSKIESHLSSCRGRMQSSIEATGSSNHLATTLVEDCYRSAEKQKNIIEVKTKSAGENK
jgi:hypothetical protein